MMHARFMFFWGLSGLCEFPFLQTLLGFPYFFKGHTPFVVLLHVTGSVLLFFCVPKGEGWFHPARMGAKTFFYMGLFLPFVGWIISGILYIHFIKEKDKPYTINQEDDDNFFMDSFPSLSLSIQLPRRNRLQKQLDFIPLVDIIRGPEEIELKRGAIEKLAQINTPETIDLLFSLRSDPVMEVRFYATSALGKIKKEFDERLDAAKEEIKKTSPSSKARLNLAQAYLEYAQSHLLDKVTTSAYETEALFHLQEELNNPFPSLQAFWMLIDLYKNHRRWEQALDLLEKLEHHPETEIILVLKSKIEIIYLMQRYQEIPVLLEKLTQKNKLPDEWTALAQWWGAHVEH